MLERIVHEAEGCAVDSDDADESREREDVCGESVDRVLQVQQHFKSLGAAGNVHVLRDDRRTPGGAREADGAAVFALGLKQAGALVTPIPANFVGAVERE